MTKHRSASDVRTGGGWAAVRAADRRDERPGRASGAAGAGHQLPAGDDLLPLRDRLLPDPQQPERKGNSHPARRGGDSRVGGWVISPTRGQRVDDHAKLV